MKFLVFGFSVTGENDGFVERASARSAEGTQDVLITKIAIGGLHAVYARHLAPDIIKTTKPDALVIEMATSSHRCQEESAALVADQRYSMEALFEICKNLDIPCGLLDLPRVGVTGDRDWLVETNAELARQFSIPHQIHALDQTILKDEVHPTDEGKDIYAEILLQLIGVIQQTKPDFKKLATARTFDAYAIKNLDVPNAQYGTFSRAGFTADVLLINEGETISIPLPRPSRVTGLLMQMGPKSGTLKVHMNGTDMEMLCYDQHSYFVRMGGKSLKPTVTETVIVTQDSAMPQRELLKGEKDYGHRIGGISYILYEKI